MAAITPSPFAPFEFLIAWRYLRARRAEGGVSTMTWISLIGIALAVAALIITLAVRSGFRAEFVETILGANAHVTLYSAQYINDTGQTVRTIVDYDALATQVAEVPGVTRVAPLVKGQVMASARGRNTGVEVFGIAAENLATIPLIAEPIRSVGALEDFGLGVAVGEGVARSLGLSVGDPITLISPNGVQGPFGTSPRISDYNVAYIFASGQVAADRTRIYMPLEDAQIYFDREGMADELEIMVRDPEAIEDLSPALLDAAGERAILWTWKDTSGAFLRALEVEDTVMFVLMSILVLIAAMNIISGLVMLVKNKGRDIGILRTMGLTEGSVLRVFFICGAFTGVIGTIAGVILGCLFALYFDQILAVVNGAAGGGVWDPSVRGTYRLPAKLEANDVFTAIGLSLFLSFVVTIFPARRAARLNPVEALRYE
ncbi:MAG: lipoprotein-releasing ABC transporter permease subunit [Pseudomonadota bacterium]